MKGEKALFGKEMGSSMGRKKVDMGNVE